MTATMNVSTVEPKGWVGCLACYNEGRHTGDWVDAREADEYVPCKRANHEEWWVMDFEGMRGLISGECSPHELARAAELLDEADELELTDDTATLFGLWASNCGSKDLEEFEDSFRGVYESLVDYAYEFDEACTDLSSLPAHYQLYRDDVMRAWARDLELGGEVFTLDLPGGDVAVFSNR